MATLRTLPEALAAGVARRRRLLLHLQRRRRAPVVRRRAPGVVPRRARAARSGAAPRRSRRARARRRRAVPHGALRRVDGGRHSRVAVSADHDERSDTLPGSHGRHPARLGRPRRRHLGARSSPAFETLRATCPDLVDGAVDRNAGRAGDRARRAAVARRHRLRAVHVRLDGGCPRAWRSRIATSRPTSTR